MYNEGDLYEPDHTKVTTGVQFMQGVRKTLPHLNFDIHLCWGLSSKMWP